MYQNVARMWVFGIYGSMDKQSNNVLAIHKFLSTFDNGSDSFYVTIDTKKIFQNLFKRGFSLDSNLHKAPKIND